MNSFFNNSKKGQQGGGFTILWSVILLAAVIVVWGIFQSFGAQVTSEIQADLVTGGLDCNATDVTGCGYDYNITQESLEGQYTLAKKQNTVALIGVVTIIIGLLMGIVAAVMLYTKYY